MRDRNPNKPIEPITLKNEVAVPTFVGKDARLGGANRSGRRAASVGGVVGLDYTKDKLTGKMYDTIFASIFSVAKAKYIKDEEAKDKLLTVNQLQNAAMKRLDAHAKKIKKLQEENLIPEAAAVVTEVLQNPNTEGHGEILSQILDLYEQGDSAGATALLLQLGEAIGEEPTVDPKAIPGVSVEEIKYQEDLAAGLIHTDGLSVEYDYDSFIPTDSQEGVEPTPIKGPVFDPERYEASLSAETELSAEEYNTMTNKQRQEWRENDYTNKIEYYHPDKGWIGYMKTGWTKARWRSKQ